MEADDSGASKVVSRYMKFSQESTNALQQKLLGLRMRHDATVKMLESQLASLQNNLSSEQAAHEQTQRLLYKTENEVTLENDSRRREIALRIRSVDQMMRLLDLLEGFSSKYRPALQRYTPDDGHDLFTTMTKLIDDFERLRADFNGPEGTHRKVLYEYIELLRSQNQFSHQDLSTIQPDLVTSTLNALDHSSGPGPNSKTQSSATDPLANGPELIQVAAAGEVIPIPALSSESPHPSKKHDAETPSTGGIPTLPKATPPRKELEPAQHAEDNPSPKLAELTPPKQLSTPQVSSPSLQNSQPYPAEPIVNHEEAVVSQNSIADLTTLEQPTIELLAANEDNVQSSPISSCAENVSSHRDSLVLPVPESTVTSSVLDQLATISSRYDRLEKSLRTCSLAIHKLRDGFNALGSSEVDQPFGPTMAAKQFAMISDRLDDYNEDARVELEIAIADEERAAQGFIALSALSIEKSHPSENGKHWNDEVVAFLREDYPAFKKISVTIQRKIDDIEHDIGILQGQLRHSLESHSPNASGDEVREFGWTSWANGVLSPSSSRPSSPRSPSFGTVMSSRSSRQQLYSGLGATSGLLDLSNLGLRISCPAVLRPQSTSANDFASRLFPTSRSTSLGLGIPRQFTPFSQLPRPISSESRLSLVVSSDNRIEEGAPGEMSDVE